VQPPKLAQYQAYALANQTAPKTRQIVMLYDGAIRNLRQAKDAIEGNRIEERYHLLVKASDIIMGLQSCLDFDNGGEIAQILYDFYSSIDARIISIHRTQSAAMCEALVNELKQMRDAWNAIDQQSEQGGASAAAPAAEPIAPTESASAQATPASGAATVDAPADDQQPSAPPSGGVEISA
jgi:flagellar protein FliS